MTPNPRRRTSSGRSNPCSAAAFSRASAPLLYWLLALISAESRASSSASPPRLRGLLSSTPSIPSPATADTLIPTKDSVKFVYPDSWLGDQTLLYRAAGKAERALDPPPLSGGGGGRRSNVNEPAVAFGPPGSTGELNVSVIVSQVAIDFSIEAFGGADEVGEAVIRTITRSGKRTDVKGTLIGSSLREDSVRKVKYYELEFGVESPIFRRHNVAVCCARKGRLFTLNAQAPESAWPQFKSQLYTIADSFNLV